MNVIQTENNKPGTTNWQIANLKTDFEWRTQNPSVDPYPEIEGYASDTSINRGGTIRFFVNTRESSFKLAIYRVGWYGGTGGRQVWPLTGTDVTLTGTRQPMPALDPVTGMAECNWTESYRVTVPNTADKTDWASGVYLVKLTAGTSGKQSYITFVVRDDTSTSDYLFQSSATTSQAYNPWGGKSLYGHNSTNNAPARKVSFNRPYAREHTQPADYLYITNGTRFGAGLFFEWEINFLRFLEREGYDVSYLTNLDVHSNGTLLRSHKAFLSVGHDEYWTYQMKSAIHAAQANGVHLGFFAANEAYWQIRLEPSSTGQANRTIVGYKEAANCCDPYAKDTDPSNDKFITTRFRDLQPVFNVNDPVAQAENGLIGVMYHGDPINGEITVSDATSWVYAGTGLANGSNVPGILGYETDAVFDNGHSPQGLSTVADSFDPWGDSQMTTYTAPNGSNTFATGSMQWNWSLDGYGNPCGTPCVSPAAQQIVRNVLARFVQPAAPLPVPQNVQATAGNTQIDVTWSQSSGATSYNVYRSTVPGGGGGSPYRSGVTAFAFTDTGLTNGTQYYYRVSALYGSSESALSNEVSATPSGSITSQWTFCANEGGTCTFQGTHRVRYGVPGQYSILTRTSLVPCNNDTFGDPAFGADKICEYETVSTSPPGGPPTPQSVQATAGNAQVDVTWSQSSGATAYNIYRSTVAGGEGSTPYRSGVTSFAFTDTGLTNGTRYFYRVSATNGSSESALSTEVSAIPSGSITSQWVFCANEDGTCTYPGTRRVRYGVPGRYSILTKTSPVPCNNATFGDPAFGADKTCEYEALTAAPSGLRSTISGTTVRLTWTQSTSGTLTNNRVYRSTSASGPFNMIATVSPTTSYNDNSTVAGTTYFYAVTAVNANGESGFSNMIQVRR